ncbi:MAG TPA: insulinase family protein [Bacteroidetes bacterium]|nr:insulinase family protein [Bacteroidota bacterium]
MIEFERFTTSNGLRVLIHEDMSTPLVALNLLYDVGSKDENPEVTGLAHLFEHLMFSGTNRIPDFDKPVQIAGGESNAFTNTDITNYYIILPKENIETAFWLESDRMEEINLSDRNIDIQKQVVTEEFKQRYQNQPYGDALMILRKLAFEKHPYRWATIGADISHVQKAEKKVIKDFYYSHYAPNNAILCLSGNITAKKARNFVEKWFCGIEARQIKERNLPAEPIQTEKREIFVNKEVPTSALYKAWHGVGRCHDDFNKLDMITDLLAGGTSGYLQNKLVREQKLFSAANIYVTAEIEPGLIIFSGKMLPGVDPVKADKAVGDVISGIASGNINDYDIEKVKNRYESATILGHTNILNKAMDLCLYELIGDPRSINREVERYRSINRSEIISATSHYLNDNNCSTLFYLKN